MTNYTKLSSEDNLKRLTDDLRKRLTSDEAIKVFSLTLGNVSITVDDCDVDYDKAFNEDTKANIPISVPMLSLFISMNAETLSRDEMKILAAVDISIAHFTHLYDKYIWSENTNVQCVLKSKNNKIVMLSYSVVEKS